MTAAAAHLLESARRLALKTQTPLTEGAAT